MAPPYACRPKPRIAAALAAARDHRAAGATPRRRRPVFEIAWRFSLGWQRRSQPFRLAGADANAARSAPACCPGSVWGSVWGSERDAVSLSSPSPGPPPGTSWWARLHAALMPDYNPVATAYWWVMVVAGSVVGLVCGASLLDMPGRDWLKFVVGLLLAVGAGLFPIRLPGTKNLLLQARSSCSCCCCWWARAPPQWLRGPRP